ncbi:MAG: hypothetical protein AAB805_00585 [Patescibacteria group bacterium]
MSRNTKKILIVSLVVAVLAGAGFFAFLFFSKEKRGSEQRIGFLDFVSSFFAAREKSPEKETGDSAYSGEFSEGGSGQNVFDVSPEEIADAPSDDAFFISTTTEDEETSPEFVFRESDGSLLFQEVYTLGNPDGKQIPRLYALVKTPIAGMTVLKKSPKNNIIVRYMERATGHIYNVETAQIKTTRITKTTIPRVREALFSQDASFVVARYLDGSNEQIETFVGAVPKTAVLGGGPLTGKFLPRNIFSVALSPIKNDVFYMQETAAGGEGFVAPLGNTTRRTQVFSFPLSEWLSVWHSDAKIAVFTKPSSGVPGYLYTVAATGNAGLERVAGNIPGLTALPNADASFSLVGRAVGGTMGLWVLDRENNIFRETTMETLPEKCAWRKNKRSFFCAVPSSVPSGTYPDSWYQGAVSFSDDIWEMDAKTGRAYYIARADGIDATYLTLSSDERLLFFTNKNDASLWVLNLTLSGD